MSNEFESLLDPSERDHAVSVMREWVEMGDSGKAAAVTIERLIVCPLDWWIESQKGKRDTSIEAAAELCMYARDMAHRFKEGRSVYQERVGELDSKWTQFQVAMGYGAIAREVCAAEIKRRWQQSGGKAKKDRYGPFRWAVIRLAERLRSRSPEAVLKEMRADCNDESDVLDDLRCARDNPVVIRFNEVPENAADDKGVICFVDVRTDKEDSRSIKVLKNYLAPGMLPKSG